MICVACYLASKGAKMTEATAVLTGQSLCSDHLAKVATALEAVLEAQPDVTPHKS
jgi:hypothetical protein